MTGTAHRQLAVLEALAGEGELSVSGLAIASDLPRHAAQQGAAGLLGRGYVQRIERGRYRITGNGRRAAERGLPLTSGPNAPLTFKGRRPRRTTLADKVWMALRIRRCASTHGILNVILGSGEREEAERMAGADGKNTRHGRAYQAAVRYLNSLARAGIVRRMRIREPGLVLTSNGFIRYRLIHDLGPQAPQLRRGGNEIYDPNDRRMIPVRKTANGKESMEIKQPFLRVLNDH